MDNMKTWLTPLGRLLLSSVLLWDGVHQLRDPGGTEQYFEHVRVPAAGVRVRRSTDILTIQHPGVARSRVIFGNTAMSRSASRTW